MPAQCETAKVKAFRSIIEFLLVIPFMLGLISCIPHSMLHKPEFQDEERVSITCEWINKGFQFKRLVFCESTDQYMVLYHQEPWLTYDKNHFQRYLSYLLKIYLKQHNLDLSKFQFSKISVWIHAHSLSPENVSFYVQMKDLLVHLPLYPKSWDIGPHNTFYFVENAAHFPYSSHKKLELVDVELKESSLLQDFNAFIRDEFPQTKVISAEYPIVRLKVPTFLEILYSSKMFFHPTGKKIIKDIKPVPAPGVKIGDLKRMAQFSLFLAMDELKPAP